LFINQILDGLKHLHKPQLKFLQVLFTTFFVCQSKINFSTLARHSDLNEKTFRRNFRKKVDFIEINRAIIEKCECRVTAFAMDASFIRKSGKETFGLDKFWNGCSGTAEKGLEASIISLVDDKQNASFVLTVDQTQANLSNQEAESQEKTRIDFYAEQVEKIAAKILKYTRIGLFDGFYAKEKFVRRMAKQGFTVISRLRQDASLKYLYEGEQKGRGRPKKYAGKVDFSELHGFEKTIIEIENKHIKLLSKVVWSVSLKRKIKLLVVQYKNKSVNLFSTDVELAAGAIFRLYRSRFTIEFLIRDAKQSGGLNDCQARDNQAIEFHWNTALTTVNLGRAMAQHGEPEAIRKPFSLKSIKQQFFNGHLLRLFIGKLDFELSLIKYEDTLESLRNYAVIIPNSVRSIELIDLYKSGFFETS
jgi:hypothetical protein